jgi:predicted DNA-binding transcriptional regulator YafY
MLTGEEASALFMGAELAKQFSDGSLRRPLEAGVLKVRAILPRDRQDYIDQLNRKTAIFGSCHTADAAHREWLLPLQEAAVRRRLVALTYRGRNQDANTERTVEPLGVVFYAGLWYLVAWCRLRRSLRHFRLDRIRQLSVREESFQPRPDFNLADHVQTFTSSEKLLTVRVRIKTACLERARREWSVSLVEEQAAEGGAILTFATHSLEWLAAWLLSFGGEAEALEPEALRKIVRDLSERVFKQHAGTAQLEPQPV